MVTAVHNRLLTVRWYASYSQFMLFTVCIPNYGYTWLTWRTIPVPVRDHTLTSQYMSLYISCRRGCSDVSSVVLISCTNCACSVTSSRRSASFCRSLGKRKVSSGWLASRWSRNAWTMPSCSCSTRGASTRPGRSESDKDNEWKKDDSLFVHLKASLGKKNLQSPITESVTSTADNSRHKKGQVAVVQLQRVEARRKLELRLHHVTKWTAEAFEEFTGNEASATGHQEAVFVHAGGQQGEEGFVNTVLQQGHLNVRKEESRKSRSNYMKMKNLRDRKARGRCSFPRPTWSFRSRFWKPGTDLANSVSSVTVSTEVLWQQWKSLASASVCWSSPHATPGSTSPALRPLSGSA